MISLKIGIYAGSGTSHSWLWFADLFEKAGFYDLFFLDEVSVRNNDIKALDVLVVSGGDTFAVAQSLGKAGGEHIRSFVEGGGMYIGSCAGAYLPMNSSKKPLDLFNFVDVKITNLSKTFPVAQIKTCKFCTAYGCDFVFHPVREAVSVKTTSFFNNEKTITFDAPLYGGPGMKARDPSWVLAVYDGFTSKTAFLTTREIARKTLINQGAVLRIPFKSGVFYLLGPHLEHPKFKQANQFITDAICRETGATHQHHFASAKADYDAKVKLTGKEAKDLVQTMRRELSNSRIVAGSLEFLPIQWRIGQKTYEPQKIRVYLEALWKRLKFLEKKTLCLDPGISERITTAAGRTTIELRRIKQQVDEKKESIETAIVIFDLLHILSISFFELYFSTLSHEKLLNISSRR
jgi:hypothetical protein